MSTGQSHDWRGGYPTEVSYTGHFYPGQAPVVLRLLSMMQHNIPPQLDKPFTYCELGCGEGVVANMLAALHPQARIYANDFNPAHIRRARVVASDAGLENVTFLESSFAEMRHEDLPKFDFITLHGIYTWVNQENRHYIQDFISKFLSPGGLVYIGYYASPVWETLSPIRRLMVEYSRQCSGMTYAKIQQSREFIAKISDVGCAFFNMNPHAAEFLKGEIRNSSIEYMAHDYFSQNWSPMYHADLVADMEAARVSFLGSTNLIEQIEHYLVSPETKPLLDQAIDPVVRETVKDYLLTRGFRRDVFVRGPLRLTADEETELQQSSFFALVELRDKCDLHITVPAGEGTLADEIYTPILDALAEGPKPLAALLALPPLAAIGPQRVWNALMTLCAVHYAAPTLAPAGYGERMMRAARLNQVLLRRALARRERLHLASPVLGVGVPLSLVEALFLVGELSQAGDIFRFAAQWLEQNGETLIKEGKVLDIPEERNAELRRLAEYYMNTQRNMYKMLGLLPSDI